MIGLGRKPAGPSYGYDVTPDGLVIVGSAWLANGHEACCWTNGVMSGLGVLPGGSHFSTAYGVSGDGSVIVGKSASENGGEAFRWDNGILTGLGDLPGGGFDSEARDISSDGDVIVGQGLSENGYEACRWAEGQVCGLGDLNGGDYSSIAYGVSGDGNVIVGSGGGNSGQEAFMWDATNGMRSLVDVLASEYGLDLSEWQKLTAAYAISADGRTIVGDGVNLDGDTEAWVARIPEPTTLLLLIPGGYTVLRRRR